MSKRILLVGGAGYIGSHCALALNEYGMETIIFDDLSTGHREAAIGKLYVGDIRDRKALMSVFKENQIDAVMHFAAKLLVGESVEHPLRYYDTNVAGTISLLQCMQDSGINKLVFSSTCAVYGVPQYLPLDENHPKSPVSPYGQSKLIVEQVLDACREKEGFNITALRYFNAAGAHPGGFIGESHLPETHLIPLALEAAVGKRQLKIFGRDYDTPDGTCIRDYIHVSDLADAHRLSLEALFAGQKGRAYNLGTGTGTSVLEILESIERVTGKKVNFLDSPRREGDPPALYAFSKTIIDELGWSPKLNNIDDIVETAWKWFRFNRYG